MPKTTPAEWLLARITDPDRAAAILGDLTEISHTRGRLWFWTVYARTCARLLWRPTAAFLLGYLCYLVATFTLWGPWGGPGVSSSHAVSALHQWVSPVWLLVPFAVDRPIFSVAHPLFAATVIPLWFALPYVAVRYGFRDRLVQLASVTFVASALISFDPPTLTPLFAIAAALGTAAALLLPGWRKPILVLTATLATGIAALAGLFNAATLGSLYIMEQLPHSHIMYRLQLPWKTLSLLALLVPALVCSRLHRRLLRDRPAIA